MPIEVAGTAWGSICAVTTKSEPIPPDAEGRLGRFCDLVATSIANTIMREELVLRFSIRDDGIGGADASLGSGLTGLRDRIEALGGRLHVESPRGRGTSIEVEIPAGQSKDQAGQRTEGASPAVVRGLSS